MSPLWRILLVYMFKYESVAVQATAEMKTSCTIYKNPTIRIHSICLCWVNFNLCRLFKIITPTTVNNLTFVSFLAQMPGTTVVGFIIIRPHLQQKRWTTRQVAPSWFTSGSFLSPRSPSKRLSKADQGINRSVEESDEPLHNLKIH